MLQGICSCSSKPLAHGEPYTTLSSHLLPDVANVNRRTYAEYNVGLLLTGANHMSRIEVEDISSKHTQK